MLLRRDRHDCRIDLAAGSCRRCPPYCWRQSLLSGRCRWTKQLSRSLQLVWFNATDHAGFGRRSSSAKQSWAA